ncbi:putative Zn-dependent peptidase [Thermosporothrix hazakensis]|uniref:Zinc protease n=2 Tax=Thermosporothrix TaxID=768650 RepID=A0A455SNA5_9CHLR|nr:pitrilysin family protein [Thermosporothrix hazakensis]PZW25628.1 putative Zn-dependent peptidase [Thermosporothrix hazakensis]BBH89923.1 zinc protease [Thermosporothrix sp. COM3]GCE48123.1 zinc protease [Thermosporothrix hazakensis]
MAESRANGTIFHTHRLSNGLQIVAQPMPDFESVAVAFYVKTGSRDEKDPSIAGVSHFLEHMVFKGTQSLDWQEITLAFNKIGAELNAFTSHEATLFYARVLGEYLDRALELLSDMMYPRLAESDFEMEKEVIVNEIARSEDQPYNYAYRRMMQTYFGDHPLGHDVLGTRESIRNMRIEQMRNYWQQRYAANNIILTVAGNFDWNHLVEKAEQLCSSWRTGDASRDISHYEPAQPINNIMVDKKLKQQIMLLAMPSLDVKDPDYYAALLGGSILGDSDGSRLYWNIYQRGLAESASAGVWAMEGTGLMLMEANSTPEDAPKVLNLLRAELDSLLTDGVHEDELRRAKDKWISSMVLSSESTFVRMRSIASDWVTEGRLLSVDEEIERIEKVTTEDIMRALHRFPMREKQVLTALGPLTEEELLGTA